MNNTHQKILDSVKKLIESDEFKNVLQTSEIEEPSYYLLNPQIKIVAFLNRNKEIILKVDSNGLNGFTEYKKTIIL